MKKHKMGTQPSQQLENDQENNVRQSVVVRYRFTCWRKRARLSNCTHHELENTVAAQSATEEDVPNNAVDHPNDAELPTGADNSNGDVQFRILGNGRGLSSDILSTIQRQLQSMVDGEVGTNVVEGNEMNIEGLGSALSTMGSEEDAGSNSGELDMHQLQRALFSSLQALGSSTTTTTTTTTTSPSGEVSQLVYVAVATNGAPQIRLALPVSDDVSVDNLLSSDTLVMSSITSIPCFMGPESLVRTVTAQVMDTRLKIHCWHRLRLGGML